MFGHFAELFACGAVFDGVVVVDGVVLVAAGVVVVVAAEELPDAALAIAALPPASAAVAATLAQIVASRLSISNHLLQLSGVELRVKLTLLGGSWGLAGSFLCVDPG
jgi:hypothetical protein